jgi:hypothetical protein
LWKGSVGSSSRNGGLTVGDRTKQKRESALLPDWPIRVAVSLPVLALFSASSLTDWLSHSYWVNMAIDSACMAIAGFFLGYRPRSDRGILPPWERMMFIFATAIVYAGSLTRTHIKVPKGASPLESGYFYVAIIAWAAALIVFGMLGVLAFRRRYPDRAFIPPDEEEESEATPKLLQNRNWILAAALTMGLMAAIVVYHLLSKR